MEHLDDLRKFNCAEDNAVQSLTQVAVRGLDVLRNFNVVSNAVKKCQGSIEHLAQALREAGENARQARDLAAEILRRSNEASDNPPKNCRDSKDNFQGGGGGPDTGGPGGGLGTS